MKAAIVAVGDEIVSGRVEDTNTPFLAGGLQGLGVEVVLTVAVKDEVDRIKDALRCAGRCADLVVVSGGLGPTTDDVTMAAAAAFFSRPLVADSTALQAIRDRFRSAGLEFTRNNEKQALFPERAEVLSNPVGTAPGCMVRREETEFFFLPGVPLEFEIMVRNEVLPLIESASPGHVAVAEKRLCTFGITESKLGDIVSGLGLEEAGIEVSYRAIFPENHLGLIVLGDDPAEARQRLAMAEKKVRQALGGCVYGEGDTSLEEVAGSLLRDREMDLAVAETFTGGLLQARLAAVPESEHFLRAGIVAIGASASHMLWTEEDDVGMDLAGGPEAGTHAVAAARAVRERSGADIGLALIGGATRAGEEGTAIAIGLDGDGAASGRRYRLRIDHERAKVLGAALAVERLRRHLLGIGRLPWDRRWEESDDV